MAQVIGTIPDAVMPRLAAAFAKVYKYSATITNEETGEVTPNPESIQQFVFRHRIKYLKDVLKAAEVPDLALSDRAAKIAEIDAIEITMQVVVP